MGIVKSYDLVIELGPYSADRQCDKCNSRADCYCYTDGTHNVLRCNQHRDDQQ